MELEVSVGGMELEVSRVIHLSQSNFIIKLGGVAMDFRFINDDGKNRWAVGPDEDGKSLSIKLYNFKSRVGVGRVKPISLGSNDEHELFLTFFVETLSVENDERVVSLNIFKRDKAND